MYEREMAECTHRIALGDALNTLLNFNPDFKTVVLNGFLKDEVLRQSLNINNDKAGTIQFLKGAASFKKYLDRISAEAEQARVDLKEYQSLT